jgi:hypothetical protein
MTPLFLFPLSDPLIKLSPQRTRSERGSGGEVKYLNGIIFRNILSQNWCFSSIIAVKRLILNYVRAI